MTEMMTIPIGYVAIPIYEYQYLLSLKPRDEKQLEVSEKPEQNFVIAKINCEKAETDAEKAKAVDVNATETHPKRTPRGKNITSEQDVEMYFLRQSGMSVPKIAEKMGIGEQTVRNHLAAYAKTHPNAAMKYANRMTMAGIVQ